MKISILAIFLAFCPALGNAMEFSRLGGTFLMEGEIEKNDSIEFLFALTSWEEPPTIFHINSKGGNLDEAMMIREVVRESQIPIWSGSECYSACVFIYVAGVERDARGKIGLHRPYFDKKYFSGLSSLEAKKKYAELKQISIEYLNTMEVSQSIIERIFQTGSTEVDIVEADEANRIFGFRSPFYEEWLTARCGKYTEEQSRVLDSWSNLLAARATIQVAQDDSLPKAENYGSNIQELIKKGQLAFQLEKAGMLKPYIELSEIHNECERQAENSHVYGFHRSLQQYVQNLYREIQPNK